MTLKIQIFFFSVSPSLYVSLSFLHTWFIIKSVPEVVFLNVVFIDLNLQSRSSETWENGKNDRTRLLKVNLYVFLRHKNYKLVRSSWDIQTLVPGILTNVSFCARVFTKSFYVTLTKRDHSISVLVKEKPIGSTRFVTHLSPFFSIIPYFFSLILQCQFTLERYEYVY